MAAATIGIDIGGTFIKGGVLNGANELVDRDSIATEAEHGAEHVVARVVRLVHTLRSRDPSSSSPIRAVGLGCPGPLSHVRGIVFETANLPGWRDVPLRDRVSEAVGLPAVLDNDANVAAYGEFVAGAGRNAREIVVLTLGTGVGGGIISDGRILRGRFENAAELGHMIVEPNGRACPCGQFGCLERYASAAATAQRCVEAIEHGESSLVLGPRVRAGELIDSVDVAAAAEAGDEVAVAMWGDACRFLAIACVSLQHVLNPERIVLGGGLAAAGKQLLTPVRKHFEEQTWRFTRDRPRIELAALGNDAGIIGAAALAREVCV